MMQRILKPVRRQVPLIAPHIPEVWGVVR